jgi:ADP-heptose:LPS heptosyltransferase
MLCAVPALRALRASTPAPAVTLVGAPGAGWFRESFPTLFDDCVDLQGWPGIPEAPGDPSDALALLQELRRQRFDLALQLHGDGNVTNMWIALTGATRLGVMSVAGAWVPPGASVAYVDPATDEVARQLAVLEAVGIHAPDRSLQFPIEEADLDAVRSLAPPRPYLVLHPGSSDPSRRWPAAGFAAVAAAAAKRGVRCVTTGVAAEAHLGTEIARLSGVATVDLIGRMTLRESAALLAGALGAVTNDTGMSHLAAAVGVPAIVMFHAPDHRRWLPRSPGHVPVSASAPVERTVAITLGHVDQWLASERTASAHG